MKKLVPIVIVMLHIYLYIQSCINVHAVHRALFMILCKLEIEMLYFVT